MRLSGASLFQRSRIIIPHSASVLNASECDPELDLIYDDLFILRYVLSKKNDLKKAEAAIRECCRWRADPDVRKNILKPVADNSWWDSATFGAFKKHMCTGVLGSQVDGGCLFYIRDGLGQPNTVFESLTVEQFMQVGFQSREYVYRWCDTETRRLGRFVKGIFVMDMNKVKLTQMPDSRVTKCYAELSVFSENNNPQMVDKYLIVNAPSFIPIFIKLVSPLFPRSFLEKVEIFPTKEKLGDSDFGKTWLNLDFVPDYLGGRLPLSELPEELTGKLIQEGDGDLSKINVGRRSKKYCEIMVPQGGKVNYKFSLASKGVYLTSTFHKNPQEVNDEHESPGQIVLQEKIKVSSENGVYSGSWEVPERGLVVVELSNSHSRFTGKVVKWCMTFE